jgi:EmrB/QacA subfamily drug resistance transporter
MSEPSSRRAAPDTRLAGPAPNVTVTGVPIHGRRPVRPVLVMTVFCLGLFMTLLDITIVNIAIPDLVTDLDATLETVLWVGSAYSLTYTVLLITAGRLGDIYGPRRLFLLGLTVFTAASLASGLSQTPGQLIAFRALQGVGAALLAPQGLPIITSILPAAKRGPAFAATGIMSGLGVLLGPTLGGFIVTTYGWRWIFFLNVPIGVIAIALAFAFMPDVRPGVRHRLDFIGVGLLTAGLFGVVFGLIEGQRYDWGTVVGFVTIPLVIAVGALLLGLFLWRQFRTQDAEPLLPFAVFSDRTFTVMTLVLLAMGFAMVGVFLPMTIYYQSVLGLTAVAAGLVIGTQSLAMMITSGVVGGLSGSGRINMKWVLIAGLLLFAGGMVYVIGVAQPDSGRWAFVPGLVAAGIGLGCVWTPVFGLATRDMPPSRAGIGAGVLDTVQEFGAVLATAVLGALLANRLTSAMQTQAHAAAAGLPQQAQAPFVDAMTTAGSGGIEVGAGQASGSALPSGVPAGVAEQIHAAAQHVFATAFTDAMRPTMVLPIVVILLAAGAVLFVRSKPAGVVLDGSAGPAAEPGQKSAGQPATVEVAASAEQPSPR